jgi:hypothetical protein
VAKATLRGLASSTTSQRARIWCRRLSCARLLPPSSNVDAHCEEPQGHRSFAEQAQGQIVGGQIVCERRRQKGQPTPTGQRHQCNQKSRQEGRREDEVADQEAMERVKSYADEHASMSQLKKL